jgi:hypothetical protein
MSTEFFTEICEADDLMEQLTPWAKL